MSTQAPVFAYHEVLTWLSCKPPWLPPAGEISPSDPASLQDSNRLRSHFSTRGLIVQLRVALKASDVLCPIAVLVTPATSIGAA